MCFGNFYKEGMNCSGCKVMRSCKRESVRRISGEHQRQALQGIQVHTINRFSRGVDAGQVLCSFIGRYSRPVSTYRLTKDFKRFYNVSVSDTTILELCLSLMQRGVVGFVSRKGGARYWFKS